MTALGIHNPNSKWMREYNGRNGGGVVVTHPKTLREELNAEYTALMVVARPLRASRKPADVAMLKRTEARMADISEQLRILKAFDPAIVRLVERVNIRNFREETRKMRVAS